MHWWNFVGYLKGKRYSIIWLRAHRMLCPVCLASLKALCTGPKVSVLWQTLSRWKRKRYSIIRLYPLYVTQCVHFITESFVCRAGLGVTGNFVQMESLATWAYVSWMAASVESCFIHCLLVLDNEWGMDLWDAILSNYQTLYALLYTAMLATCMFSTRQYPVVGISLSWPSFGCHQDTTFTSL